MLCLISITIADVRMYTVVREETEWMTWCVEDSDECVMCLCERHDDDDDDEDDVGCFALLQCLRRVIGCSRQSVASAGQDVHPQQQLKHDSLSDN